jgi:hypothetical protein
MEKRSDIGTDRFFEEAARNTLFEGISMSRSNSGYTDRLKEIGERAAEAAEQLNEDLHNNKRYFQFVEREVRAGVEKLAEQLEAVAKVADVRIRYGSSDIRAVMRALTSRYSMDEITRAYDERDEPKDMYGDRDLADTVEAYAEYIQNKDSFNRGRDDRPLGSREYAEVVARAVFGSSFASDFVRSDDWGRAVRDQIERLVENMIRLVQRARNFCEFADRDQRGRVVRVIKGLGVSDYLASNVECELEQVEEPLLTDADERAGVTVHTTASGERFKDFTVPIDRALTRALIHAEGKRDRRDETRTVWGVLSGDNLTNLIQRYGWFYHQMNHEMAWDIKEEDSWNKTIAPDTYPGRFDTPIVFNGMIITPEDLGNYTYGYIGAALGIPLGILHVGSWYADGWSMPSDVEAWANETRDWTIITEGYYAYKW